MQCDARVSFSSMPVAPVALQLAEPDRKLIGGRLDLLQAQNVRLLFFKELMKLRLAGADSIHVPGRDLHGDWARAGGRSSDATARSPAWQTDTPPESPRADVTGRQGTETNPASAPHHRPPQATSAEVFPIPADPVIYNCDVGRRRRVHSDSRRRSAESGSSRCDMRMCDVRDRGARVCG